MRSWKAGICDGSARVGDSVFLAQLISGDEHTQKDCIQLELHAVIGVLAYPDRDKDQIDRNDLTVAGIACDLACWKIVTSREQ